MRLLLIRHPRPDVAEGTCYGRTDVAPQAGHLREVVDALRERWRAAGRPPAAVYSSPLQRCALVAHALAGDAWPHPRLDDRIAEMDFGRWEGNLWSRLPRDEIAAWRADITGVAPPGGESLGALAERVLHFTAECLSAHAPGDEVVLVTHAGVIQTMHRVLRDRPLEGFGSTPIDFGSISTLVRHPHGFEIESLNVSP